MDESWRKRVGTGSSKSSISDTESDPPVDFNDVFGGPPRSAMQRKYCADNFSTFDSFYHEVFQAAKHVNSEILDGQRLPGFLIPDQRRFKTNVKSVAMSKSKSTSSSVLSFDEFSPYRSVGMSIEHEDVGFMDHTTKLRPLNVPHRWSSTSPSSSTLTQRTAKYKNKKQDDYQVKSFTFGFPHHTISTPESTHFDPDLVKRKLVVDYQLPPSYHSPSSTVMSSSYVIEMNSPITVEEANNSDDIDDAIAWAKEKFQG